MCKCGNRLHFNCIHFLERMVEDTRRIDCLETEVFVVKVTNIQTLCGERVGLNIYIGAGDALEETRLSDVGVTADQERPRVGVNGGETAQMLADLGAEGWARTRIPSNYCIRLYGTKSTGRHRREPPPGRQSSDPP